MATGLDLSSTFQRQRMIYVIMIILAPAWVSHLVYSPLVVRIQRPFQEVPKLEMSWMYQNSPVKDGTFSHCAEKQSML